MLQKGDVVLCCGNVKKFYGYIGEVLSTPENNINAIIDKGNYVIDFSNKGIMETPAITISPDKIDRFNFLVLDHIITEEEEYEMLVCELKAWGYQSEDGLNFSYSSNKTYFPEISFDGIDYICIKNREKPILNAYNKSVEKVSNIIGKFNEVIVDFIVRSIPRRSYII
jgi:hypothetical protein